MEIHAKVHAFPCTIAHIMTTCFTQPTALTMGLPLNTIY